MRTDSSARPGRARALCPLALLLLAGGLAIAVAQGTWHIPVAAFVGYALLVRAVRLSSVGSGYLGLVVAHTVAWDFAYSATMPLPLPGRLIIAASVSIVLGLVFLADRWTSRRSTAFLSTLVFPAGLVSLDYLMGTFSPGGSGGSIAYSFTDQLAFAQLASLTGWTGITFVVGWVAATANWAWEHRQSPQRAVRGILVCAGILVAIVAFGSVRLWTLPEGETVRIACVVGPSTVPADEALRDDVLAYLRGNDEAIPEVRARSAAAHIRQAIDRNMALAERELQAGARMVLFPEASPVVSTLEAGYALDAARGLAAAHEAYVGLGAFVFPENPDGDAENTFTLVAPDGSVVWTYLKSKLVPGSSHAVGPGLLPVHDAGFARLTAAICFDLDFPALIGQAGRQAADIMLAPSNDWTGIRLLHARMARMRVIEQGFVLVRPTGGGISLVTDPMGRTLAWQDTDRPGDHVLVADVPTGRVATVYARIGNLFPWLCVAGFGLAVIAPLLAGWRS